MKKKWAVGIEIEKKAFAFRQQNGLSSTEPIRLKSLLLKLGVQTLFRPLSEGFAGMAIKVEGPIRFMLVNSSQSIGKQHFTIGHELYHLHIQENFQSQRCVVGEFDEKKDPEEFRADLFSAFLLLPEEGIKQMVPDEELGRGGKVSIQTILKIEQYYSVSRRALLYRLRNLEFIQQADYEAYASNVKRSAHQNGYTTELYDPGNKGLMIGDYGVIARGLLEDEKISESHYMELMGAIGVNPLEPEADDQNGNG